jgi:hypothetical protein
MMKKITKTIFLIVFVVFLGTTKVNALIDYGRTCYYTNGGKTLGLELDQNYVSPIMLYHSGGAFDGKNHYYLSNWSSGSKLNKYKGSFFVDAFVTKEYNAINSAAQAANITDIEEIKKLPEYSQHKICPDYLVTDQYDDDAMYIFMADSSNSSSLQDAKDAISDFGVVNHGSTVYNYSYYVLTEKQNATEDAQAPTSMPDLHVEHATVVTSNIGILDDDFTTYSCGDGYMKGIPATLPKVTRLIYNFIMVLVPIVLVVLGTLDLVKAIMSQKDDEIKKGRLTFGKRCVTAVIIFFAFALVKLIISFVSKNSTGAINCAKCFLSDASACQPDTNIGNRGE